VRGTQVQMQAIEDGVRLRTDLPDVYDLLVVELQP
jgi:hypothetical protein